MVVRIKSFTQIRKHIHKRTRKALRPVTLADLSIANVAFYYELLELGYIGEVEPTVLLLDGKGRG